MNDMKTTYGEVLRQAKTDVENKINAILTDFAAMYGLFINVDVHVSHIKDKMPDSSKPRYTGKVVVSTRIKMEV